MSVLTGTPVKRQRRSKAELAALDREIIAVLEDCQPQSVRHVFYRMTDPRLPVFVPKTDSGPGNGYAVIQRRMVELRLNGALPYDWVTDFTRRGYHVATYKNRGEFLQRVAGLYRADLWSSADSHVEVWCESRSIAGVIEDLCDELGVSLYPTGDFSSLSLIFNAAESIKAAIGDTNKPVNVIYIGDYDPAGVLIDKDIERKLRGHLGIGADLVFHRIGINEEQVAVYDLPTKPRKTGDRRARHIDETVEAEAMPAPILLQLLREKVESFLPEHALAVAKAAEKSEQRFLRDASHERASRQQNPQFQEAPEEYVARRVRPGAPVRRHDSPRLLLPRERRQAVDRLASQALRETRRHKVCQYRRFC